MNKEEFLQELGEIMMLEEQLELSTELETLDAYDSMTHLTLLGIFEDEFGKEIESKDLIALKTVGDLVALAGLE
jgi:acyl carrier protein|tara:strand:- start:1901 stop:2122 length:222 start_codon:yes stop_codon:yes gene_type:complete